MVNVGASFTGMKLMVLVALAKSAPSETVVVIVRLAVLFDTP
jgi:hypothetical protein